MCTCVCDCGLQHPDVSNEIEASVSFAIIPRDLILFCNCSGLFQSVFRNSSSFPARLMNIIRDPDPFEAKAGCEREPAGIFERPGADANH